MLARALLATLILEVVAYALAGHALVTRAGWSAGTVVVAALATHVGLRLAVVLLSFVLARRQAPGWGSRGSVLLRAIAEETWVILVPFGLGQIVFARRALEQQRTPPAGSPVLLVHGYVCNAGLWMSALRRLRAEGWHAEAATIEPVLGDLDLQAEALAKRIDAIAPDPGTRVAIVAHSMGGLVVRAYARKHGLGRVASLMTLGSPHRGTALAPIALGRCARQMTPGSPWIEALWADVGRLAGLPTTVLRTTDDNLVAPPDTTLLPGARVVTLAGVSHTRLPLDERVQREIIEHLRRAG